MLNISFALSLDSIDCSTFPVHTYILTPKELFARAQEMLKLHHRAPAAKKTNGGFLLTTKLFCGECGKPMIGDSGTSHTGRSYYYYTCKGRRSKKCTKERVEKQWIEDTVVAKLVEITNDDSVIQDFADCCMEWQAKQKKCSLLSGLEQRLKQNEAAIRNTMSLIDSGLITDSLRSHLMELESERKDLEKGIAKEMLETPEIDRESIVWFLKQFRTSDQSDIGWRIFIVETFLQAAYLYDDNRLTLQLNISNGANKSTHDITQKRLHENTLQSSTIDLSSLPHKNGNHFDCRFYFFETKYKKER